MRAKCYSWAQECRITEWNLAGPYSWQKTGHCIAHTEVSFSQPINMMTGFPWDWEFKLYHTFNLTSASAAVLLRHIAERLDKSKHKPSNIWGFMIRCLIWYWSVPLILRKIMHVSCHMYRFQVHSSIVTCCMGVSGSGIGQAMHILEWLPHYWDTAGFSLIGVNSLAPGRFQ